MDSLTPRPDEAARRGAGEPATASPEDLRRQMSRVIEEYLRLDSELRRAENTNFRVAIFGSARIRRRDPTWQSVYWLAKRLARNGVDIVTGGGPGLMEAASRATQDAHDERAKAYGLPLAIPSLREPANVHLDIKSSHQRFSTRLDEFMRLSHAIVVAPGGIGTLLELMYVWQLVQIGLLPPRPVLLLGQDFWEGFLNWIRDHMGARAYINPEDLDYVRIVSREEAVEILEREQRLYEDRLRAERQQHVAPVVQDVDQGAGLPVAVQTAAGVVMTPRPGSENAA